MSAVITSNLMKIQKYSRSKKNNYIIKIHIESKDKMKKHTISLIACLLSSTAYSVELSDLNQELISNCKNKIEQLKLRIDEWQVKDSF